MNEERRVSHGNTDSTKPSNFEQEETEITELQFIIDFTAHSVSSVSSCSIRRYAFVISVVFESGAML
jgi:hypothetical protein